MGGGASLTVLKFPAEDVGTRELVHHASTIKSLSQSGLRPGPIQRPGGAAGPQTSWLNDPDGYRVELVEWPEGHRDGVTAADFD